MGNKLTGTTDDYTEPHILIHHFTDAVGTFPLDEIVKFNIEPGSSIEVFWSADRRQLIVRGSGTRAGLLWVHPRVENVIGVSLSHWEGEVEGGGGSGK